MLRAVSSPSTASGDSTVTLSRSFGSSTSPPEFQINSRPFTTPPSYSAPWKTKPYLVPESDFVFSACSLSSSQVLGGSEKPLFSRRSLRQKGNPASGNPRTPENPSPEVVWFYGGGKWEPRKVPGKRSERSEIHPE